MSKHGNLFLVINLGCEMLYVIDQRLRAQNVTVDKGIRVLTDITGILFNPRLLDELFEANHLSNQQHIRILLEDIASVSIMRLDSFSMNKLWELMTMVFKWQVTGISSENLHILTERHLRGVLKLISGYPVAVKVEQALARFQKLIQESSIEHMVLTRNSLLFWLNDFRTKVSLLLRLGLQRNDGSFVQTSHDNEINKFLQNLGDNIYSYSDTQPPSDNIETEMNKTHNTDISEVSFLVHHILGESDNTKENINISLLHQASVSKQIPEVPDTHGSVCKFQPNSYTRNIPKSIEILSKFDETNLPASTLQEDLLTMLDSESNK